MEKATVEKASLQLITERAKLENPKAKVEANLACSIFFYKHNLTQGTQWQDSCTKQNHFIVDLL